MSGEAGSDKAGSGEAQGGVTGVTTSLETREGGGGRAPKGKALHTTTSPSYGETGGQTSGEETKSSGELRLAMVVAAIWEVGGQGD